MPNPWYVYIGRLKDDRFYVGTSQQQPQSLLAEHHSGKHSQFTRAEGMKSIEWTEPHLSLESARRREQQLKKWTHAKKQALIDGDKDRLKALSRSRRNQ